MSRPRRLAPRLYSVITRRRSKRLDMPVRMTPRGLRSGMREMPSAPAPAPAMPLPPSPPPPPPQSVEVFSTCANCGISVLTANRHLHEMHCSRHYKMCPHCGIKCEIATFDTHISESIGAIELLSAALAGGDAGRVKRALNHASAQPELLTWRDEGDRTLLHLIAAAASHDRWDMHALVEQCIRLGADVNARDALGWAPLHAAAKAGSVGAVNALLSAGADVSARNPLGSTALEVCVGEDVRAALLTAGAQLPGSLGSSRTGSRAASRGSACNGSISGIGGEGRRRASCDEATELSRSFLHATTVTVSDPAASATNGAIPVPPSATRSQSSSRSVQRLRSMVEHGSVEHKLSEAEFELSNVT